MLFLVKGITQEMLEEAYGKFNVFNLSKLDQYVNTAWTVAKALVDFFRIIGARKQQCTRGIVRRCHAIKHVEYLLQFGRIGDKCLEVFKQDECRKAALCRHMQCLGEILPGTAITTWRSRRDIQYKTILLCM